MLDKLAGMVLLLTSFPLLALSEQGNPFVDDWEAANCPSALPADEHPYMSRIEHYAYSGDDEKYNEMVDKAGRYSECVTAITTSLGLPIAAYDSYQVAMKMGDVETAEGHLSLEAILKQAEEGFDPQGPIYPVLRELYQHAYSQEMSDMAEADPEGARELLTREYLCDCLTTPLEEFNDAAY